MLTPESPKFLAQSDDRTKKFQAQESYRRIALTNGKVLRDEDFEQYLDLS